MMIERSSAALLTPRAPLAPTHLPAPFDALAPEVRALVAAALTRVRCLAGETLIRQGESGDALYVVESGHLAIRRSVVGEAEQVVDTLGPGATCGELALLTGEPRSASIVAQTEATLLRLGRADFARLSASYPDATRAVAEALVPRLLRAQMTAPLMKLFGPLDEAALREVQAALSWVRVPGGSVLCRQGEPGDALYLVVSGRLRLSIAATGGGDRALGEVGYGECVGEHALLTGEAHLATVRAVRDTALLRLPREEFVRLVERYPRAGLQLARETARAAVRAVAGEAHGASATTFALVPLSPDVALAPFARALTDALHSHGATLHLSAARFAGEHTHLLAAQTVEDHPTDVAIAGWLSERERTFPHVVYEADPTWTPWTRRCLRQADRILLVGRGGADPRAGALERAVREAHPHARVELVLIHPDETPRPSGTAAWLAAREVAAHHHVRLGVRDDLARLARRILGRALGLVLGGGGARSYAHIGVFRALDEAGIAIDMLGGTSMGALVGGGWAQELDAIGMRTLAATFGSRKALFDYTLPLVSFFESRKVTDLYRRIFGDVQIEDLWRPFFCVSTNLSRAVPVVHDRGPLWEAVRASTAIPGIFAPTLHGGDVLVDGGVMNNFPLDIMRERIAGGPLIGVLTSPLTDKARDYAFGPSISGWQVLRSRLNPLAPRPRLPNLFGLLMRSTEVHTVNRLRSERFIGLADLLIHPRLDRFRTLDFAAHEAIIGIGYDAAREQLAGWDRRGRGRAGQGEWGGNFFQDTGGRSR